jgi:tetratricopeptide (TPR) repeat protein
MKHRIRLYTSITLIFIFFIAVTACKTQKTTIDGIDTPTVAAISAQDYLKKGNEQLDLKNYNEALILLNKAVELDPENGENFAYRGMAKYHLDDFKGAILDYDKAVSLIPDYGEVYDLRGIAKGELGDKVGACEDWNKAFELGFNKAYDLIEKYCIDETKSK